MRRIEQHPLRTREWRVFAVDMRNHGLSEHHHDHRCVCVCVCV
jgi:pimeloyl-ACP methyl ester carboxylesterase